MVCSPGESGSTYNFQALPKRTGRYLCRKFLRYDALKPAEFFVA